MTEETSSLAAWESQKENVEPLRKGRHAKSLYNALKPTGKSLAALKEERKQFENEILAEDNSEDPLSTWDRYLKWTDQNFPVGGNKEDYLSLLYRIVQKFWDNDQYKNDDRLIRVCLLYATMQHHDRALQVFYNLYKQQVGVKSPELYKLWVEEYEKTSNMKEANKVFKRAQTYLGECNEELNKIRKEFDFRCGREIQRKMKEEMENGPQAISKSAAKERKTLGKLRTYGEKKKVGSVRPKAQGTIRVRQRDDVLTESPKKSNSRLQVFADDDNDDDGIIDSSTSLKSLSHHRNVDKENFMGEPSLWKGKKVKQSYHRAPAHFTDEFQSVAVAPQPQSFAIFTENEEGEDDKPSTSAVWNTEVLQPRKTGQVDSKTANILLGDSKGLFSQSSESQKGNLLQKDPRNESSIYMFPVNKVYSEMGEFQLEEIFYAHWSRQQKIIAQKKKEQQEQQHFETERELERKEMIKRRDEQIKLLYQQMCEEDGDDEVEKEEEEEKNKATLIEKKEVDGIEIATGDSSQVIEKDLLDLLGVEQPRSE